ncbi:hypothetical protein [Anaerotruncus rubiinfantis]|uniref:hypothetical protein n=1 Tax=Anaerotruncus rubiinfantis TaxID=1720200 RepID=UPI0034A176D1
MEVQILNYDFNKIFTLLSIALENYVPEDEPKLDVLIRTTLDVVSSAQTRMNKRASAERVTA